MPVTGPTWKPNRDQADERGNAMVETALVFIPMLAMFFGIVDVSMIVFNPTGVLDIAVSASVAAPTYFMNIFNISRVNVTVCFTRREDPRTAG